jgi:uncharacterized protein (TIGR02117 family)
MFSSGIVRILLIGFALLLAGCSVMPAKQKIPVTDTEHIIHFIYRDWHTSILLDARTAALHSKHLKNEAHGQEYIRIGWGDGNYFTGKSKSVGSATRALLASSHSALQVITYLHSPFEAIPQETRVAVAVSEKGMRNLIHYLDKSFALDDFRQIIPLQSYVENAGRFYRASGHYSVFSNCNTWSGRALQAAGLPVRSSLQLTAQSVFEQARFISQYQKQHGLLRSAE